jgi:hypothetical protein
LYVAALRGSFSARIAPSLGIEIPIRDDQTFDVEMINLKRLANFQALNPICRRFFDQ